MKKILCLLLALMMLFSVATLIAGCEDSKKEKNSSSKNDDEDKDEDEDDTDTDDATEDENAEDDEEEEPEVTVDPDSREAYIATWKKERTEDSPFSVTIQLRDDGTGNWGKNTTLEWTFDEEEKCISVTMFHSNGQERGDTFTAKLQEDGTLYCDYTMTVKLQSEEMIEVEGITLQRSK